MVFKASFFSKLGANNTNTIDSWNLFSAEMRGTTDLIEKARNYALDKMLQSAAGKKANAVIGINYETAYSNGEFLHISMSVTAVRVAPIQNDSPAPMKNKRC